MIEKVKKMNNKSQMNRNPHWKRFEVFNFMTLNDSLLLNSL